MIRDNLKRGSKASKLKAYNEGYSVGLTAGDTQGYSRGYSEGETAGDSAGYTRGYSKGKTDGDSEGYTRGYGKGKTDGDSEGYTRGYSKGQQDYQPVTQTKSVTPSTSAQTVTPDSGKLLSSVSVAAIPNQKSGKLGDITASGSSQKIYVPAGWYNGTAYYDVAAQKTLQHHDVQYGTSYTTASRRDVDNDPITGKPMTILTIYATSSGYNYQGVKTDGLPDTEYTLYYSKQSSYTTWSGFVFKAVHGTLVSNDETRGIAIIRSNSNGMATLAISKHVENGDIVDTITNYIQVTDITYMG